VYACVCVYVCMCVCVCASTSDVVLSLWLSPPLPAATQLVTSVDATRTPVDVTSCACLDVVGTA
jgi:hypothetical protein